MSHSSVASVLDVDLQPGKPPVVRAEAGGDAANWAARYRDVLRAVVAEQGCVLVRGLGLRDAAGAGAVFRRLAVRVDGREGGVRAAAALSRRGVLGHAVAGESADVHAPRAELRAGVPRPGAVRLPDRPRGRRGDRGGRRAGRAPRAARRPGPAVRAGRLGAHPQLQRGHRGVGGAGVRHRRPARGGELLPGQRDRVRLAARRRAADPAAAQRGGAPPGHRAALLVQPDRVLERADDRPRSAGVPGRGLRPGRAAVHHLFRERRPGRRGRRGPAQPNLRGA